MAWHGQKVWEKPLLKQHTLSSTNGLHVEAIFPIYSQCRYECTSPATLRILDSFELAGYCTAFSMARAANPHLQPLTIIQTSCPVTELDQGHIYFYLLRNETYFVFRSWWSLNILPIILEQIPSARFVSDLISSSQCNSNIPRRIHWNININLNKFANVTHYI